MTDYAQNIQRRAAGGVRDGTRSVQRSDVLTPRHRRLLAEIPTPVRGLPAYVGKIARTASPATSTVTLLDSATVPVAAPGEELVYLHYVGRGLGRTDRSRSGLDRSPHPRRPGGRERHPLTATEL